MRACALNESGAQCEKVAVEASELFPISARVMDGYSNLNSFFKVLVNLCFFVKIIDNYWRQ